MNRKLIIAALVVGLGIATFTTVLVFWFYRQQTHQQVASAVKANVQAVQTNQKLASDLKAGNISAADVVKGKAALQPVDRSSYLVTTLIVGGFCFIVTIAGCSVLWYHEEGMPLTWAEALTLAATLFFVLIEVNGIIPHYLISLWDNWLKTPTVLDLKGLWGVWPTRILAIPLHWLTGNSSPVRGFEWSWQTLRDMIVAGWYVVTLVAMIVAWYWVQELPKRAARKQPAEPGALRSPYGRPMLSTGR